LVPVATFDVRLTARQRAREAAHFLKVRRAEGGYARALRKIARHVAEIVRAYPIGDIQLVHQLTDTLTRYAGILDPWAKAAAARMIAEVSRRDENAWFQHSRNLGRDLRREIRGGDIGDRVAELIVDQVKLIKSIPIDEARRVQEHTSEYIAGGKRYSELVPLIMNTGVVTVNRANLIARTEVAKASSALTQARAEYIGSEGYIWRTVMDLDVRPMHKKLEGTYHKWTEPPIAETGGQRHHPGEFPNCRCFVEPVIPDVIT